MNSASEVPRASRRLLEALLAPEHAEDVLGDLEERFRRIADRHGSVAARRWYHRQALLLCLRPSLLRGPRLPSVVPSAHGFAADVRLALRVARKEPVASAVVVLSLALAIGAFTAVLSAVDRFLIRMPDGIERPERVVEVYQLPENEAQAGTLGYGGFKVITPLAFRALLDGSRTLREGSLISPKWALSVQAGGPGPERMNGAFVSANFFEVLGVRPAFGRLFDPWTDALAGESPVVVLTHDLWQRRFGGDPAVIGRTLHVEGVDFTIVGIAPRGFVGTSVVRAPDFWLPHSMMGVVPLWGAQAGTGSMFVAVARMDEAVNLPQVEAELEALGREYYGGVSIFRAAPLREVTVDPNRREAFLDAGATLLAAVGTILLVACLNVANILLARSVRRRRELAVRVALGAGRGRLVRQLFTESALLFLAGAIAGVGLLLAVRPWLGSLRPPDRFFFSDPTLELPFDLRVMTFVLLVTGLAATAFGMLPAWRAARTDPRGELQGGARGAKFRRLPARDVFVLLQVALSLVALAGAGLFARGLHAAHRIEPGFEADRVGMLSVNLHYAGLDRDQQHEYYRRAVEAARAVPGVEAAGVASLRPLEFGPAYRLYPYLDATVAERIPVRMTAVTPGYFETLGIPLLAGREVLATDHRPTGVPTTDAHMVVVVNEEAARFLWPGEPPREAIGRHLRGDFAPVAEVVGVVPTGRYITLGEEPTPAVYQALEQRGQVPTATLLFRASGPPEHLLDAVVARVRAIDSRVPVYDVEPARALLDRALWGARAAAGLLAALGTLALLLAAIGIYGVAASAVGERRREIGIRIALGAGQGRVYRSVVGRLAVAVGLGAMLGAALVLAGGRMAAGLLYGVPPTDRLALAAACVILFFAALAAASLPARSATRVNPLEVIRSE